MNYPELLHGTENTGAKRLTPDIPEQLELAKKIDTFLQGVFMMGIEPEQKSRILKDYRSPQPGDGIAHVSVGYSETQDGQFRAEIQTNHRPAGIHSHYNLLCDGEAWMRTSKSVRGKSLGFTVLDLEHMLQDMEDFAPDHGEVAQLQDRILTARALVMALFNDMNRGAHYKAGSDYYRTVIPTRSADGSYASARHIELIDGRVNNRIERWLSVTALANYGQGPIDVTQKLVYGVQITKDGTIKSDGIQLVHTSSDGLSPQTLTNLAESSDVVPNRIDILHKALDDLSKDTFPET